MANLKKISLSNFTLKCVGWFFTLCAVAAMVCFPQESDVLLKTVLRLAGHIALPVFALLLVEGFGNTQSLKKYMLTILVFAVVTEPFFDYVCGGIWLDLDGATEQNFLFALLLGLVQLYFLRYMGVSSFVKVFASVSMVLAAGFWCFLLNIPYGFFFQLLVGCFYLLREKPKAKMIVGSVVSLLMGTGVLAMPLLLAYNEERGSYCKYIFYALFPLVWIIPAMIRLFAA